MKWTTVCIKLGAGLRSWRGKADARFRRESEEDGVAYVATDNVFTGEKVEDDRMSDRWLTRSRPQILQGQMGDESRR